MNSFQYPASARPFLLVQRDRVSTRGLRVAPRCPFFWGGWETIRVPMPLAAGRYQAFNLKLKITPGVPYTFAGVIREHRPLDWHHISLLGSARGSFSRCCGSGHACFTDGFPARRRPAQSFPLQSRGVPMISDLPALARASRSFGTSHIVRHCLKFRSVLGSQYVDFRVSLFPRGLNQTQPDLTF